jgi:hypothetical protein
MTLDATNTLVHQHAYMSCLVAQQQVPPLPIAPFGMHCKMRAARWSCWVLMHSTISKDVRNVELLVALKPVVVLLPITTLLYDKQT